MCDVLLTERWMIVTVVMMMVMMMIENPSLLECYTMPAGK
jgi:hypothetical protein